MPILNDKEYKCDLCQGIFNLIRSREETEQEYQDNFPKSAQANAERYIVCDDCYKLVTGQLGFPEK